MVLKEHLRELNRRRVSMKDKQERRELSKYIRKVAEELKKKHSDELAALQQEERRGKQRTIDMAYSAVGDIVDEVELRSMFAHLVTS